MDSEHEDKQEKPKEKLYVSKKGRDKAIEAFVKRESERREVEDDE
jgi:predicted Co/Zn/Cd cation transporter (cation efflux family)